MLVPAVNTGDPQAAALPEAAVRAVLSAIGLGGGAGTTWVTTGGRWANGVLEELTLNGLLQDLGL